MAIVSINPTVDAYIQGVIDGSVVVCEWTRKAVQRHIRDLERGHERGLYYDPDAANHVIDFCQTFCVPPNQSEPMRLYPAQQCFISILYGWKRKDDDTRRFRRAFWLVAKKAGKSGLTAALCLYHLLADGEQSARCFVAATTMKQARTVFKDAYLMRNAHPELKAAIQQAGNEPVLALHIPDTGSRLSPMARDAGSEDGAVVSFAVCDEIHRWKNRDLFDVLRKGGRTRKQPLIISISTAGSSAGKTSVCWDEFEYGCKILDGIVEDDQTFPWFFTLDPKDDWRDEKNWVKANPALGHLFSIDTLRDEYNEALGMPASRAGFKRFSLNIWSDSAADPAIDIEHWDACTLPTTDKYPDPITLRKHLMESLKGRLCFGGLDLAPQHDTSALVLLFPPLNTGQKWSVLEWFWCPEGNISERAKQDRVPYEEWSKDGHLIATPGDMTDVDYIRDQMLELITQFNIKEVYYDRAKAWDLIRGLLAHGFPEHKMVPFNQSPLQMTPPSYEMGRMINDHRLVHAAHPVMRWQMSCLRWKSCGSSGLIKPDRDRKREKIDGCVSLTMAVASATSPDNIVKPKKKFFAVTI